MYFALFLAMFVDIFPIAGLLAGLLCRSFGRAVFWGCVAGGVGAAWRVGHSLPFSAAIIVVYALVIPIICACFGWWLVGKRVAAARLRRALAVRNARMAKGPLGPLGAKVVSLG